MTNQELEVSLGRLVREERRLTGEILSLINLADERKSYLDFGYSSLFEWLTKHFGYSEPAASRRISAARVLKAVPSAVAKIETGAVNLTTLAKAHSAMRAHEKETGVKLSNEEKSGIVETLELKSAQEAEKVLVSLLPESTVQFERKTLVSKDISRLAMNLSNDTLKDLERIKELISHVMPEGASFAEIVTYLAKDFLKRKDPLVKSDKANVKSAAASGFTAKHTAIGPLTTASAVPAIPATSAAAKPRVTAQPIPARLRREVMKRDQARCTYQNPSTGRVCGSRYQIQLDHIYPRSLGGENTAQNLRCLCRKHNLHAAELILGTRPESFRSP